MTPVILSGGSGTRLWPASRSRLPKQFAAIFQETLFSQTLTRLRRFGTPWVVTTRNMKELTEESFRSAGLNSKGVLYEPVGRNTAAAIAFMCFEFQQRGLGKSVVGIFPADHLFLDEAVFGEAMSLADSIAKNGEVITLGIKPSYPSTGYGYIETADRSHGSGQGPSHGLQARAAIAFHEKPDLELAKQYLAGGRHHWNAGVFIFRIDVMIALLETHQGNLWGAICELKSDHSNLDAIYEELPSISLDYAVMEKLKSHICIPCDPQWSDVGTWDEVTKILPSSKEALCVDSSGCFVFATPKKMIALIDVEDLIVADTGDALLISKKGSSQKVREAVERLKVLGSPLIDEFSPDKSSIEFRPWGKFEILRDTESFKSKILTIEAGQQISYQSHAKRSEHWIVIQGFPEVVLDGKIKNLKPGESIFVPQGAKHRIRNSTDKIVEIVEVQVGTYFGEDDIVRYEDDYNRV